MSTPEEAKKESKKERDGQCQTPPDNNSCANKLQDCVHDARTQQSTDLTRGQAGDPSLPSTASRPGKPTQQAGPRAAGLPSMEIPAATTADCRFKPSGSMQNRFASLGLTRTDAGEYSPRPGRATDERRATGQGGLEIPAGQVPLPRSRPKEGDGQETLAGTREAAGTRAGERPREPATAVDQVLKDHTSRGGHFDGKTDEAMEKLLKGYKDDPHALGSETGNLPDGTRFNRTLHLDQQGRFKDGHFEYPAGATMDVKTFSGTARLAGITSADMVRTENGYATTYRDDKGNTYTAEGDNRGEITSWTASSENVDSATGNRTTTSVTQSRAGMEMSRVTLDADKNIVHGEAYFPNGKVAAHDGSPHVITSAELTRGQDGKFVETHRNGDHVWTKNDGDQSWTHKQETPPANPNAEGMKSAVQALARPTEGAPAPVVTSDGDHATSVTYPNGFKRDFGYDADGKLASITGSNDTKLTISPEGKWVDAQGKDSGLQNVSVAKDGTLAFDQGGDRHRVDINGKDTKLSLALTDKSISDFKEAIGYGYFPDSEKAAGILTSMTKDQRAIWMDRFRETNQSQDVSTFLNEKIPVNRFGSHAVDFAKIDSALKRGDGPDYVGSARDALGHITQGGQNPLYEQQLAKSVLSQTPEQFKEFEKKYQQDTGHDFRTDVLKNASIYSATRKQLDTYFKGVDQGVPPDKLSVALAAKGVESGRPDLANAALELASPAARKEFTASEAYKQIDSKFWAGDAAITKDYANLGYVSLQTLVEGNTGYFHTTKEAISQAIAHTSPEERKQFVEGEKLAQSKQDPSKLNEADKKNLEFFKSVDGMLGSWKATGSLADGYSGKEGDIWKAQLRSPDSLTPALLNSYTPGWFGSSVSERVDNNKAFSSIEGWSKAEMIHLLQNRQQEVPRMQETIDKYFDKETAGRVGTMVNTKLDAAQQAYDASLKQSGAGADKDPKAAAAALDEAYKASLTAGNRTAEQKFSDIQHDLGSPLTGEPAREAQAARVSALTSMAKDEWGQYKANTGGLADRINGFLSPTERVLAGRLAQTGAEGKDPDKVSEALTAGLKNEDPLKTFGKIEEAMKGDPKLREQLDNPQSNDDKALSDAFMQVMTAAVGKAGMGDQTSSYGESATFVEGRQNEYIAAMMKQGQLPLPFKAKLTKDTEKKFDLAMRASPQEAAQLLSRDLNDKAAQDLQKQVLGDKSELRDVLANAYAQKDKDGNPQLTTADQARLVALGAGSMESLKPKLEGTPEQKQANIDEYFKKYGSLMAGDLAAKAPAEQQLQIEQLVSPNRTSAQQTYLNALNDFTKHASGCAGLMDTVWDSTNVQRESELTKLGQVTKVLDQDIRNLSPEQQQQLATALTNFQQAQKLYIDSKGEFAASFADATLTAAAVVATMGSGGAASWTLALRLGVSGAIYRVGVDKAIVGSDSQDTARHFVEGGFTGIFSAMAPGMLGIGQKVGGRMAETAAESLLSGASKFTARDGAQLTGEAIKDLFKADSKPIIQAAFAKMTQEGAMLGHGDFGALAAQVAKEGADQKAVAAVLANELQATVRAPAQDALANAMKFAGSEGRALTDNIAISQIAAVTQGATTSLMFGDQFSPEQTAMSAAVGIIPMHFGFRGGAGLLRAGRGVTSVFERGEHQSAPHQAPAAAREGVERPSTTSTVTDEAGASGSRIQRNTPSDFESFYTDMSGPRRTTPHVGKGSPEKPAGSTVADRPTEAPKYPVPALLERTSLGSREVRQNLYAELKSVLTGPEKEALDASYRKALKQVDTLDQKYTEYAEHLNKKFGLTGPNRFNADNISNETLMLGVLTGKDRTTYQIFKTGLEKPLKDLQKQLDKHAADLEKAFNRHYQAHGDPPIRVSVHAELSPATADDHSVRTAASYDPSSRTVRFLMKDLADSTQVNRLVARSGEELTHDQQHTRVVKYLIDQQGVRLGEQPSPEQLAEIQAQHQRVYGRQMTPDVVREICSSRTSHLTPAETADARALEGARTEHTENVRRERALGTQEENLRAEIRQIQHSPPAPGQNPVLSLLQSYNGPQGTRRLEELFGPTGPRTAMLDLIHKADLVDRGKLDKSVWDEAEMRDQFLKEMTSYLRSVRQEHKLLIRTGHFQHQETSVPRHEDVWDESFKAGIGVDRGLAERQWNEKTDTQHDLEDLQDKRLFGLVGQMSGRARSSTRVSTTEVQDHSTEHRSGMSRGDITVEKPAAAVVDRPDAIHGNFEILPEVKHAGSGSRTHVDIPDKTAPAVSTLTIPDTGWRIERASVNGEPGYQVFDEKGNQRWQTTGSANIFANRNTGKLEFSDGWRRSTDPAMLEAVVNGYKPELVKRPRGNTELRLGEGKDASYVLYDKRGAIVEAKIGSQEIRPNEEGKLTTNLGRPIGDNPVLQFVDGSPVLRWRNNSGPDVFTLDRAGNYERRIGTLSMHQPAGKRAFTQVDMGDKYRYEYNPDTKLWRQFDGENWSDLPANSVVERAKWHPDLVAFINNGKRHAMVWWDGSGRMSQVGIGARTFVRNADGQLVQTRPPEQTGIVMKGEPQLKYETGGEPTIVTDQGITYRPDGSTVDEHGKPIEPVRLAEVPHELHPAYEMQFEMDEWTHRKNTARMVELYKQFLDASDRDLANGERRNDASSFEMRALSHRYGQAIEFMQSAKRPDLATSIMDHWQQLTGSRHELDHRGQGAAGLFQRFLGGNARRAAGSDAPPIPSLDEPVTATRGNFWKVARDTAVQREPAPE